MKRGGFIRFVLLLFLIAMPLAAIGQNQKVKITVENMEVRQVFEKLKQQANVHFVYEESQVSKGTLITLKYSRGARLETVLADVCRQIKMGHEYKGKAVLIYPFRKGAKRDIKLRLTDKETREPLMMANCVIKPLGSYATTDIAGKASLRNIPEGEWTLEITYIGFETVSRKLVVNQDLDLKINMKPLSLSLDEVQVVAKSNVSGEATSSKISRQAVDHLQAYSLDDVMQLIPGQLMKKTDLTSKSNIQIRSLVNDNNNAFGASVVMDGVPMSNNGALSQGGFSGTAFVGTDLRQISADDIESVEVVRGIPSAEYGDLTSGLVVVHSKIGQTPWQVKGKINPGSMNYSLGKGLKLGHAGMLNFNIDYAQAWGDPRQKTKSFDRYTLSVGYGYDISSSWNTKTKVRYNLSKDWNGNDPDAIDDGTYQRDKNSSFSLTHNGNISVNKLFSRTLSYTVGLSLSNSDMRNSSIVSNSYGMLPILTAMNTGYNVVPFERVSYSASGGSKSRPGNVYAKLSNSFFISSKNMNHHFKMGADYRYDWNNARGYYNDDEQHPLRPNSSGRPRPFYDIPGTNQVSAYIEDNFRWDFDKVHSLKIQLGGRFTTMQPGSDIATYSFSPRLNMSLSMTKWLAMRFGYGINSKTPGLNYLYPDKKYTDRIAANYIPQDNELGQILMYHTEVYDVKKTVGLKNANNRKMEVGFDIKLPGNRNLSVVGYYDKTTNGFGALTDYYTYQANYYSQDKGLIIVPGQATQIDWANPERIDTVFSTTGKIGNTSISKNKGIEFDFDLGEIKALKTNIYLSGAYAESVTSSSDMVAQTPTDLPSKYSIANTTPFKIVYPTGLSKNVYRRFSNSLRLVTHIPALKMVASLNGQVVWYNYSHSVNPPMSPIGWIDTDLSYHQITQEMLADENYKIKGVSLKSQIKNPKDNVPIKQPITWLLSGRLTKELGKIGGLSFYANNLIFYEPFLTNSTSSTLMQRNTGNFNFGVEVYLNL